MGGEVIRLLNFQNEAVVLDGASGTGEPGMSIAARLRGGQEMMTDLSDDMLSSAQANAARRGFTSIKTKACAACELPVWVYVLPGHATDR